VLIIGASFCPEQNFQINRLTAGRVLGEGLGYLVARRLG